MDDAKYKEISKRIRLFRNTYGFSQEYVANELGISQNVYSMNERNIKTVPLERLFKIARILNVRLAELVKD
ncbi:helix-turn-helix domain-containing protein [Pedobacter fastidiosus]|uniref:Helix-turn-helix transcriptional regulator n=1 Tax=Pedobacter fastidiosus TaxID=2765361 RepID=A0ABR7KVB4_9SPHI|nr:helix-turn-helix transcriptional regulator [Pedobacter fastidiosus]MBC6111770.1 helix-turn-helix transcriptional regulator [Pedobacter fastidiosus]